MKLRIVFIIIPFLAMCYSCSPTEPVSYDIIDLVGTWEGVANIIFLDLMVDSEGQVSGNGVSSQWSISSTGQVTGGGSFGFISGGHYIVANASWSLQLNSDKTDLSGAFDVEYSGLHDMDVNLTKSASSFLIVYITSPSDSATVSDTVDITATVRSSNVVSKVEFYIDESLKSTATSSPYSYSWNTTQYSNGSHPIEVIAYDTGDQTASDQHTVFVSNTKWEFLAAGYVESSPAIGSDGTIYVGSTLIGNRLYAINPDGTMKWEFLTGSWAESSPAIGSDGTIYVGSWDDRLYAINPDGTEKWAFLTGNYVGSSPAIGSDGTIYVGSWDNRLYGINPDGTKKWEFLTGDDVESSPAIGSDGTIYIGSNDYRLYAINPDGTKKWEFLTGMIVSSSPAIGSDGTIYIGSWDYRLYAINPDGTIKWKFLTGGRIDSSPAIGSDGTIYVGSDDKKLYALYGSGSLADTPWPMFHHDLKHTGRK